ncbi:MAG: hypothetical protein JWQ98_931 [Chlorobi bacterium]|nr:hypothetical protein [Chlorobiota bacterium]
MMRTNAVVAAALALAVVFTAGCGKEDLTKIDSKWGQKEGDVVAKVTDLKAKFGEMTAKFETSRATNVDDTTRAGEWAHVDGMLKDQGSALGTIDSTLNRLSEQRAAALKSGSQADYDATWKNADLEYERLISRIDALVSANTAIGQKITELTAPRPATGAPNDTARLVPNDTVPKSSVAGKDIAKEKSGGKKSPILPAEQPDAPATKK